MAGSESFWSAMRGCGWVLTLLLTSVFVCGIFPEVRASDVLLEARRAGSAQ